MNQLRKIIEKQGHFTKNDKLLLGISGGVDSMVLADCLIKEGYTIELAHCNYGLRGENSRKDEEFLIQFAAQHNLPIHVHRQTIEEGKNIQNEARKIRYAFFKRLLDTDSFQYILLAQHSDDRLETFFLQLARGAGMKGLTNMQILRHRVIRPFIHVNKLQILQYANEFGVSFREDASNAESKYRRNFIRNIWLPEIEKKIPTFRKNAKISLQNMEEFYQYFIQNFNSWESKNVSHVSNEQHILFPGNNEWIFLKQYLTEYGFHHTTLRKFGKIIFTPGDEFISNDGWKLLMAHDKFILFKDQNERLDSKVIIDTTKTETEIMDKKICWQFRSSSLEEARNNTIDRKLFVDVDKIQLPIYVRIWKPGDRMAPLGMLGQTRKIQDILTDKKVNRKDKKECLVFEDQAGILWLAGYSVNEHYKIDENTKKMLVIEIKNSLIN